MDETMLAVKSRRVKVLVPSDLKCAVVPARVRETKHITLVMCISADGLVLKPTAILPLKHFPMELEPIGDVFCWSGSSTGWINDDIYLSWIQDVFPPYLRRKREHYNLENDPALLWLDGHITRASPAAQQLLTENNVWCATIPGHTSHILQPLDCGFFRAFKAALRRNRTEKLGATAAETRKYLLELSAKAVHEASYRPDVQASFEVTGLWPWNPEKVAGDRSKVRELRPDEVFKPARGRGVNMSGRVLTAPFGPMLEGQDPPEEMLEAGEDTPLNREESGSGPALEDEGEAEDSDGTVMSRV
jgi:hypothetical protein